jgi:hypothetical protein
MKKITFASVLILCCIFVSAQNHAKDEINLTMDNWHKAAAEANYKNYFDVLSEDAIFIGTDATEYWNKTAFQNYARPYFDKGKAWSFIAIQRHIYFSADQKTAWFDELLNTQMKICRGSGVLALIDGHWKIKHYVLSMTIPNDNTEEVVKIKTSLEEMLLNNIQSTK